MMSSKIKILAKGSMKKPAFSIRFFVFNPKKHFISTPEAKDLCRKEMHCSKKKMDEEYDTMFGVWTKVGRGNNAHIEFNKTTMTAANVIFVFPKKYRQGLWKRIENVEIPYSFVKDVPNWFE